MKIVKSIRLSEDNIQEIMDCPVVYRISKLELEPEQQEVVGSNLRMQEKPTIRIFVQGFKHPCGLNGYLVEDTNGYWRHISDEEFNDTDKELSALGIQRLSPEQERELDNIFWKTVDDVLNSDLVTHLCKHSSEFVKVRNKLLSLYSCNKIP